MKKNFVRKTMNFRPLLKQTWAEDHMAFGIHDGLFEHCRASCSFGDHNEESLVLKNMKIHKWTHFQTGPELVNPDFVIKIRYILQFIRFAFLKTNHQETESRVRVGVRYWSVEQTCHVLCKFFIRQFPHLFLKIKGRALVKSGQLRENFIRIRQLHFIWRKHEAMVGEKRRNRKKKKKRKNQRRILT